MWQQIIETALLGTEKKVLNTDSLPEEIREFIRERNGEDSELKFLETIALTSFYLEAGITAPQYNGELSDEIIEEKQPVAPPVLMDILRKLENVDHMLRESLYNLWLDLLICKNFIINPDAVIKLLNAGNNFSNATKSKIVNVIGKKGVWILSFNADLHYKKPLPQQNVWQEGNTNERKTLFASIRKTSASDAIGMLQTTWDKESILNKRAFLEIIKESTATTDLPFIETLYNIEFQFSSKEKKTERECRKLLVDILLKHRDTKLFKETTDALSKYFNKTKRKGVIGFVTGKEEVGFGLPAEEDSAFWNTKHIEEVYGFETKNYDIAFFQNPNQYWLSLFLQVIPFDFWGQYFGDLKVAVSYFLDDGKFKTKISGNVISIFLNDLLVNAQYHHDSNLAKIIIERLNVKDALPVLRYLSSSDFDAFVKKNKLYTDYEVLQNGPYAPGTVWSPGFSQYIVNEVCDDLMRSSPISPMLGKVVAQFLHVDSIAALLTCNDKMKGTTVHHVWEKNFFEPVNTALDIRQSIQSITP